MVALVQVEAVVPYLVQVLAPVQDRALTSGQRRVVEFRVVEWGWGLIEIQSMDRRLALIPLRRWAEGVQAIFVRAPGQFRTRARSGEAGWGLRTVWEQIPIRFVVAEPTAAAVRYQGAVG